MVNRRRRGDRRRPVNPVKLPPKPIRRRNSGSRGGGLYRELSLREVLSGVNRRAWRRSHRPTVQQAIADAHTGDLSESFIVQNLWLRRLLAFFVLLPISIVTSYTFLREIGAAGSSQLVTTEVWYFCVGIVLWGIMFFSRLLQNFFLYLYVLGHELTHAVFILLSFGTIKEIHVSSEGGYVLTNKTGLLIALSPYFVPFWSVVSLLVFLVLSYFSLISGFSVFFLIMLGFTWGFHLLWTLWMIPKDQPDLRENGILFSLLFVYLVNLVIIIGLLSFSEALDFKEFASGWMLSCRQVFWALSDLASWVSALLG